jgi:FAD/FMN-containing dehydrogenase
VEDASPDPRLDEWLALGERHAALGDDIRVADTDPLLREARRLRHSVPTAMNAAGDLRRPFGGRKVSTDWAVPHQLLGVALQHAADAVREHGVSPPTVYGHAGNGHPHQNFIARDADELARVYRAVEQTLHKVISLGGTVAAEHGIGKLKRQWLPLQASPAEIAVMRAVKNALDPRGLMAPGNVL